MWKDSLFWLCEYGVQVCYAWLELGYKDTCLDKINNIQKEFVAGPKPVWLGNPDFHRSHQSNLIRKGREKLDKTGDSSLLDHYQSLWPNVPDNLPYIWPV
jgi:hypothetical protein